MQRAGADLKRIADILGHRSLDTTIVYTKVDLSSPAPGSHRTGDRPAAARFARSGALPNDALRLHQRRGGRTDRGRGATRPVTGIAATDISPVLASCSKRELHELPGVSASILPRRRSQAAHWPDTRRTRRSSARRLTSARLPVPAPRLHTSGNEENDELRRLCCAILLGELPSRRRLVG